MDMFVDRNFRDFRRWLCRETDPAARSRLQKRLVEEEDNLAARHAAEERCHLLIAEVERVITNGAALIESQKELVALLDRNRQDSTEERALLDALMQSQALHQQYHQKILVAFNQTQV